MRPAIETCQGKKLPFWLKITATAGGFLLAAFGMGLLIKGGSAARTILPIFTGAAVIYIAGLEKNLFLDGDGVLGETRFWGQRRHVRTGWDEISEARVILGRGDRIYVVLSGTKQTRHLAFLPGQKEEVMNLLREKITSQNIKVEE